MVLELGGLIELDNESSPPSMARNPQIGKQAEGIKKDEVVLFELRPHKALDVLCSLSPLVISSAMSLYN